MERRPSVSGLPAGPKDARSRTLPIEEEAIIVAFRRHTLPPLDDCLYALQGRLHTVMERVLDEISFAATDRAGDMLTIDAAYVEKHIGDLARNRDLSKFIL